MKEIKQPIGYIKAEGCGPDIVEAAIDVIKHIGKLKGYKFRFIEYKGEAPALKYTVKSYKQLKSFYARIKRLGGAIIRGGIYARQVYKLRHDFNMTFKPVPINPIPELWDISPFKKKFASKVDLLIIRENAQGLLVSQEKVKKTKRGRKFTGIFHYDEALCRQFVEMSYQAAMKRKKKIMFLIKGDVWSRNAFGGMWIRLWEELNKKYPEVEWDWEHDDTWFGYFLQHPERYDTVVALGLSGDILSDPIATLAYGTRTITPSANIAPDGFMVFQTIHGAGTAIPKGTADPIAMIRSAGLMFDYFFKMPEIREWIDVAIRRVIGKGYRTIDIYDKKNPDHKLVKTTKQMTKLIKEELTRTAKDF